MTKKKSPPKILKYGLLVLFSLVGLFLVYQFTFGQAPSRGDNTQQLN